MTRPEPLEGSTPAGSTPPVSATSDISAPKGGEAEKVYYEGSPLVRGNIGSLLLFFLIAAALVSVPFLYRYFQGLWPHWIITVVAVVLGLVLLVGPMVWARTIRYRISNFRIDFERGLLGKTIDTMELWHVDDIKFHQSFIERMLGVGTVTVLSDDQTTPSLAMRGLPRPREIFDALKSRVIAIKRSRGVVKVDSGA